MVFDRIENFLFCLKIHSHFNLSFSKVSSFTKVIPKEVYLIHVLRWQDYSHWRESSLNIK